MLPDITELEYVRKEETRPRVGDTNPPKLGGEVTSEPEGVDISQDEEDTGHQDGIDLSGRPSPCVVEHIKIEEFQEEENPVARNEDAASNDESRAGRTEDHEVDELLKDDDSTRGESQSFNFESGAQSPGMDAYSAPCLSPLDLSKSAEIEMVDSEPKEDEAQSSKAISDTSFLDAVNQDFTEVSNDSNYGEIFNLQAQIDSIVEQQSTSVQIKLNKVSKTKSLNDSQSKTGEGLAIIRDTETADGNVLPKESQDQNQKKRNKRKSSPKSPKRKKQKSALDVESNPDQPPLLSQKEGEVEEEDVLSCEMCGQLFPETEEFSRHIETDHDHQCQEDGCGLSFTHEDYLHLHEADEHPTGPPSPPNNSFGQAERWIRSGRNIQLNKFKQYKVSIISFSCFSSPIAVERMKNVMNGRRNSLRHELFLDKRERERCSGNETSRLYQLSNPGYLGGGGEKDTIVIKQLIETVFVKYFNQADSKLKKLGHKIAFDYTSCVLFPETFIHQLQVKINN